MSRGDPTPSRPVCRCSSACAVAGRNSNSREGLATGASARFPAPLLLEWAVLPGAVALAAEAAEPAGWLLVRDTGGRVAPVGGDATCRWGDLMTPATPPGEAREDGRDAMVAMS